MSEDPTSLHGPSVTVVIVSYNHGEFVETALASAFGQTYPNLSVVVADDASTDDSQATIRRLLQENKWDARTIFHDVNRGVCVTFNDGLAAVDSTYVAFIAADDWMAPHRIATHVAMLEAAGPEYAVACSDVQLVDREGNALPGSIVSPAALTAPWGEDGFFEAMLQESLVMAPTALIRTSALRAIGGYDDSLEFEDWDVWLRLARANYRFVRTDEPLVMYRQVDSSLWKSLEGSHRYRIQELKILRKHLGHSDEVDRRLWPRLYHHALTLYKARVTRRPVSQVIWGYAWHRRDPRAALYGTLALLRVPWPGGRGGQ